MPTRAAARPQRGLAIFGNRKEKEKQDGRDHHSFGCPGNKHHVKEPSQSSLSPRGERLGRAIYEPSHTVQNSGFDSNTLVFRRTNTELISISKQLINK